MHFVFTQDRIFFVVGYQKRRAVAALVVILRFKYIFDAERVFNRRDRACGHPDLLAAGKTAAKLELFPVHEIKVAFCAVRQGIAENSRSAADFKFSTVGVFLVQANAAAEIGGVSRYKNGLLTAAYIKIRVLVQTNTASAALAGVSGDTSTG